MSKPRAIIAVDIDEVCADMLGRLCERFQELWNGHYPGSSIVPHLYGEALPEASYKLLPEDIIGWDLKDYFGSHWHGLLKEKDFYPKTKPTPGARRGVHTLLSLGYRVIFVTSCVPGTADVKQQWLLKWGFVTEKNMVRDFFAASDKSLVNADVLFDDAVHNVEAFPRQAVLVNHWHNRTTPCSQRRINGLFEAPALLSELGY